MIRRRLPQIIFGLLGLTVLTLGLTAIARLLRTTSFVEVEAYMRDIPWELKTVTVILTFASYLLLTNFDLLAFEFLERPLSKAKIIFVSAIAFAMGNTVGLGNVAGSSVRLRLYSAFGVETRTILAVIAFSSVTFWLGVCSLGGGLLALNPLDLPESFRVSPSLLRGVGLALALVAVVYLATSVLRVKPLRMRGLQIKVPPPKVAITQIVVAASDWALAALVLYLLLPAQVETGFTLFLTIFVSAQLVALVAHVPGGIGVLEALILYFVTGADRAQIMGALITYRVIYYFLPFALALMGYTGFEILKKRFA